MRTNGNMCNKKQHTTPVNAVKCVVYLVFGIIIGYIFIITKNDLADQQGSQSVSRLKKDVDLRDELFLKKSIDKTF